MRIHARRTAAIVGALTLGGVVAQAASGEGRAGEVTRGQFAPIEAHTELDISGHATLVRTGDGRTKLKVHVKGLEANATYPAHLHTGSCDDLESPHYKHDPAGPGEPPNELWPSSDPEDPKAGLTANRAGVANGRGTAAWRARPEADTVFIHSHGHGHAKIACASLG